MENMNQTNLIKEDNLFMTEDTYGNESLIYSEIASEEFMTSTKVLLDSDNPFSMEENVEFRLYEAY